MFQVLLLATLLSTSTADYGPPQPAEVVKLQEFIQKRAFVLQTPIEPFDAGEIALNAISAGEEFKIEPLKILALIEIESRYDRRAKSKKKCLGLTQMAIATARGMAQMLGLVKYSLFTINDSIRLGAAFLKENIRPGRPIEVSFDIYNRGIGNWLRNPTVSGYGQATKKRYSHLKSVYKKENELKCTKDLTNR
jgi:soluble lytic murein transglycosylase-like protein